MYRVKRLLIYLTLFLFLIIETTSMNYISVKGVTPSILINFVIFFGLFYGVGIGLEVGFVCGLMKDILGISIFGQNILIFGILGLICGFLKDKIYKENILMQIIISFIATFFISKFYLIPAMYTALISPFIFIVLRLIFDQSLLTILIAKIKQ